MRFFIVAATLFVAVCSFTFSQTASASRRAEIEAIMDSCNYYLQTQDFARAQEFIDVAEPLIINEIGKVDTFYIALLNIKQTLAHAAGDYSGALKYCEQSAPIVKEIRGEDSQDYAVTIGSLAMFNSAVGNLPLGDSLFKEAIQLHEKAFPPDHPYYASLLMNSAQFYAYRGLNDEAEPLMKKAIEIYEKAFGKDAPETLDFYSNLATFYSNEGRYAEAEPLFIKYYASVKKNFPGDNIRKASAANNIGWFMEACGRYEDALGYYSEAVEMQRRLFPEGNARLALYLNNKASVLMELDRLDEADVAQTKSFELAEKYLEKKGEYYSVIKNNTAYCLKLKGEYEKALPLLEESLRLMKERYPGDQWQKAAAYGNLGTLYSLLGDYEKAEEAIDTALAIDIRTANIDKKYLIKDFLAAAVHYKAKGDLGSAEGYYKSMLAESQEIITNVFPYFSESEKLDFWNLLRNNYANFNDFAVLRSEENPAILGDMYDARLFTKALIYNSSAKVKNRIASSGDSSLISKFEEWQVLRENLLQLYSVSEEAKTGINVDSLESVANDLEKELSRESEAFAKSYEKKKISWRSIQVLLQPDEAAVEVVRFRRYDYDKFKDDTVCYAFLIVTGETYDRPDLVVVKNGADLEKGAFNYYRKAIDNKIPDNESFGKYWSELHKKIKGFKKIYFSADGVYNKINPATFKTPEGKYLIDVYDIRRLNCTKDILLGFYKSKEESNIYNNAVLIGDPDFAENLDSEYSGDQPLAEIRGIDLYPLPGTREEVDDIKAALENKNWDVQIFTGKNATKEAVKSVKSPRALHIATHGMFLEKISKFQSSVFGFSGETAENNPLLKSGLFFAGSANSSDQNDSFSPEGILTAYEAMNLDLDRTEIVALSACETGLGEVLDGEGVFGLLRAFQAAGAKTVIMSLWSVADEATQELMSEFYENWTAGMTKREAFAAAQKTVREKYVDPYYWGAFVMVGE